VTGNIEFLPPEIENFLSKSVETILKIVGRDKVELIALAGSFASGEATMFSQDSEIYILSDFDVYVVLRSSSDVSRMLKMRREIGKKCSSNTGNIVLLSYFHVGFYAIDELAILPRNPAIFNLKYKSKSLYGDDTCLNLIPEIPTNEIPVSESCVILENRACALLSLLVRNKKEDKSLDELIVQYELSRVYTDIAKSVTIALSDFVPGYRERLRYLSEASSDNSVLREIIDKELLERIELATEFKLNLSEVIARSGGPSFKSFEFERTIEDLIRSWKRITKIVNKSVGEGIALPVCSAHEGTSWTEKLRSWLSVFQEIGFMNSLRLSYNLGTRLFRFSAFDLIRSYSMVLLAHFLSYGSKSNIVSAPGGFPCKSSNWNEAAIELVKKWGSFVNGE